MAAWSLKNRSAVDAVVRSPCLWARALSLFGFQFPFLVIGGVGGGCEVFWFLPAAHLCVYEFLNLNMTYLLDTWMVPLLFLLDVVLTIELGMGIQKLSPQ